MWIDAIRGGIAGAVGTWLMDKSTSGILSAQPKAITKLEERARPNGKGSVPNLVDRLQATFGLSISEQRRPMVEQAIHYGLGIVPGAIYGLMRGRVPLVGMGRGLPFGLLLWALNDEWLNSVLGLAAPFGDYPMETHLRGLAGHAVLGATTDTTITLL